MKKKKEKVSIVYGINGRALTTHGPDIEKRKKKKNFKNNQKMTNFKPFTIYLNNTNSILFYLL